MEALGSDQSDYDLAKSSKFRLKSKSRSEGHSKRHRREDGDEEKSTDERRSHKRHRSKEPRVQNEQRRKHSSRKTVRDYTFERHGGYDEPDHRQRESLYDDLYSNKPDGLDPDHAFRESLFDALADDEGAAYWEGVYGQPVHVYADTKPGPDGKLEKMTEEEYASHVRTKMWEKSHAHIVEEREAREKARKEKKKEKRVLDEDIEEQEKEREKIRRQVQESLKRGEERKRAKEADASWILYLKKWDELKQRKDLIQADSKARDVIPWPVTSGKWRHVSKDEIEQFFENSAAWKEDRAAMLKVERVRWHPDKMQQRFGQHIDPDTMKSVTAVFQVVDRLWNEQSKRR